MTYELCAYSIEACRIAARTGVDRVELCSSPSEGGTTPSAAAVAMAREAGGYSLSVMIRPRGGDFLYTDREYEQMLREIELARQAGADSVVFGLLTADGYVDVERTARLVEAAAPMQTTFHRAIDVSRDYLRSVDDVARCGCTRILTSGGRPTALEGLDDLRRALDIARGRIEIMAGCGVNASNAARIASAGVDALHFSARCSYPSPMRWRCADIDMGGGRDEYMLAEADENSILSIIENVSRI